MHQASILSIFIIQSRNLYYKTDHLYLFLNQVLIQDASISRRNQPFSPNSQIRGSVLVKLASISISRKSRPIHIDSESLADPSSCISKPFRHQPCPILRTYNPTRLLPPPSFNIPPQKEQNSICLSIAVIITSQADQ
ncbi:hypothetical protein PGT21_036153 [Puccinia graminis f. sp. tritici]|uniref:Uncharacterized protein n=1 Tax=Puccinia graminis f. sp. tritici TaxID=56615 RepID=A0A5B0NSX8_PUCGR|nr:hypothetical protein PGT21_036153 [Puccinia graminis f. sp. tritici]